MCDRIVAIRVYIIYIYIQRFNVEYICRGSANALHKSSYIYILCGCIYIEICILYDRQLTIEAVASLVSLDHEVIDRSLSVGRSVGLLVCGGGGAGCQVMDGRKDGRTGLLIVVVGGGRRKDRKRPTAIV